MIDLDQAEWLLDTDGHLFNGSGHDSGEVLRIYVDVYTGWPSFATIASAQPGRETLVALHEAEPFVTNDRSHAPARGGATEGGHGDGGGVQVPYDQARIDGAPTVGLDQHLSISEEDALFEYYGVPIDGVMPVVEHLGGELVPHEPTPARRDQPLTGTGTSPQA